MSPGSPAKHLVRLAGCAQKSPIHASLQRGAPGGSGDQAYPAEDRVEIDRFLLVSTSYNKLAFLLSNVNNNEGIEFVRDIYDPPYGGREFGIRDPNETNLIPFGQQALDYFLRGERLGLEGSCFRFIAMSRASSAFWTTLRAIVDKGFAPAFFTKYSSAWWSRSRVWNIRSGA